MPRIILAKIHPPTSIEIPKREKGSLILLPGIPKKVTVEEVAFIKKNYPVLKFAELPTKLQRRKKMVRPVASLSPLSTKANQSDKPTEDKKSDDDKGSGKRGK